MDERFNELLLENKKKEELKLLEGLNDTTEEKFGLTLSKEETGALIESRNESLRNYQRVELGRGILDKLITMFCDSQYIYQEIYADTLMELTDIFYKFKNESQDKLTDDELLEFMKEQFETVCFGDLEYLEGTCLERFSRAVRRGYKGYEKTGGKKEYQQFSEEQRWDSQLYVQALKDLF